MKNSKNKPTYNIVVDYDNTIIIHDKGSNEVDIGTPNVKLINKLNELHDKGYKILVYTARGHLSTKSRIEADITYRSRIENILKQYNLKYDLLSFEKPFACVYIDDNAVRPDEIDILDNL